MRIICAFRSVIFPCAFVLCAIVLCAILGLSGCSRSLPTSNHVSISSSPSKKSNASLFEDVAQKSGLVFSCDTGIAYRKRYFIESAAAGGGFIDFDNDGYLDIFLTQCGAPSPELLKGNRPHCALFRNHGGTFTEASSGSGFDKDLGYVYGIAVGDYDNDGYDDIFLTSYPHNWLFHNEHGTGKFTDVTNKLGLGKTHSTGFATSAAFGDYDGDGKLDLYICYYAPWTPATDKPCVNFEHERDYCTPEVYDPETHQLFHNEGATFRNVSDASGISRVKGRGLAVAFVDFNEDGKPDIFVANDLTPNMLWKNNGDGTFENVAAEAGCGYAENGSLMAGMGIAIADYDRSEHPSLFVTSFAGMPNTLFRNIGEGQFENVADTSRIAPAHLKYLSFGCEFLDFDGDGWQDLLTANGHVQLRVNLKESFGVEQPKRLYRNNGDGSFASIESPEALGDLATPVISRGLAIGDFDNDGFVDAMAMNQNSPVQLFRNRTGEMAWKNPSLPRPHTIAFHLIGVKSNRDACHARLRLKDSLGTVHTDWVRAGSSYLSASDRRVYFGLGASSGACSLEIRWQSGVTEKLSGLEPDRLYAVTEGKGVTENHPFRDPSPGH